MGDIVKAILTTKSLSLGWSISWRACVATILNAIVVGIVMLFVGMLGSTITTLASIILGIYSILFAFMATGWAAQRIKDRL